MSEFKLYYRDIATKQHGTKQTYRLQRQTLRDKVIHIIHSCSHMIINKDTKNIVGQRQHLQQQMILKKLDINDT